MQAATSPIISVADSSTKASNLTGLRNYGNLVRSLPAFNELIWTRLDGRFTPYPGIIYSQGWQGQLADNTDTRVWIDIAFGDLGGAEGVHLFLRNEDARQDLSLLGAKLRAEAGYPVIFGSITEFVYAYDGQDPGRFDLLNQSVSSSDFLSEVRQGKILFLEADAPTYKISTSSVSLDEGATLTASAQTTNVAVGTNLYYSLSGTGITAADFSAGALTGSGTVGSDGTFSFSHTLANDLNTEGAETLQIRLFSDSNRTTQLGSTTSVTVADTSNRDVLIDSDYKDGQILKEAYKQKFGFNGSTYTKPIKFFVDASLHACSQFIYDAFARIDPLVDLDFSLAPSRGDSDIFLHLASYSDNTLGLTQANARSSTLNGKTDYTLDQIDIGIKPADFYSTLPDYSSVFNITGWTILHEICHALGLQHPNDNPTSAEYTAKNTVMSYNVDENENGLSIRQADIDSLVFLWGPERSTPSYALTTSKSSTEEGDTLATTIATTNVVSSATLYWALSGTGITVTDFSTGALAGSGTVGSDGTFSFSHTLANDQTTEGTETLEIKIFSDSGRTVQVGSTATVSIADTSTTAAARGGTIESVGRSILRQSANSQYVVQGIEPGSAQLPISKDGAQIFEGIYGNDWQLLAAETVGGVNQLLWKNSGANRLHVWSLDSNWNWLSSAGWDEPTSATGQQLEAAFGIDLDGNGTVAVPEQILESAGSISLISSGSNSTYSAKANAAGSSAVAIKKDGSQIYAGIYGNDWSVLAAEAVGGVNQVLWKNSSANRLHVWSLDSNWTWTSSSGWDEPTSAEGQQLEAQFGLDIDGNGSVAAPTTTVDNQGSVQLLQGSGKRYSVQGITPGAAAVAIKKDGAQIYAGIYGSDWTLLAAETVGGVNQLLWKNTSANRLHVWSLDANWNWTSSSGWDELTSSRGIELESQFGLDLNGDGKIAQPSSSIEEQGSTWLLKGSGNSYSARSTAAGAAAIAITKDGVQIAQGIYGSDWQVLAAETVAGVNQVLWKNTSANRLHVWNLDTNWAWKSSAGWDEPTSATGQQLEAAFGLDLDGNGSVAAPNTSIETKGAISLISSGSNSAYSALQTNAAGAVPTVIKKDGSPIYKGIYGNDWQLLAAETVNGVNQLLWKNSAANRLHVWSLDANWTWTASTGWDDPNSAAGQQLEAQFGIDLDGNGSIANPETTVESAGAIRLISSGSNSAYSAIANAAGSTAAAIKKDGSPIYKGIYGNDWTVLAAERVNGVNQVLWKNTAANRLHLWSLDTNWNWTASTGWDEPASTAGQQLEAAFGIDLDGNGTIAAPTATSTTIENKGEISLLKSSSNRYSALSTLPGSSAIPITNGGTQIYEGIYGNDWTVLAAETISGVNQVLWMNTAANRLHTWMLDGNWSRTASSGLIDASSNDGYTLESQFNLDLNGDSKIGTPYIPSTIETAGIVKLSSDSQGVYIVQSNAQAQLTDKDLAAPKEQLGKGLIRQKIRDLAYGFESQSGDVLSVLYTGRLINGTVFDTNTTSGRSEFSFSLGSGSVIQGFDLGLIGASLADIYHLEIPSSLGYGSRATGSIPADSTLLFDIEVRGITRGTSRLTYQEAIGNIADKVTIRKDGIPVSSGTLGSDWQILAAERINEVNQVLWKDLSTNKLLVWALDSSWNWTSSGALIDPLSGTAKEVESQFGVDTNGDDSIFAYKTGTTVVDVIIGSIANEFFAPLGVGANGVDRIILGGGSNQIQLQASTGGNLYANGRESDFLIIEDLNVANDQLQLASNRSYGFFPATVGADSGLAIYEDKNADKLYNNTDELLAWLKGVAAMPTNSLLLG